MRTSPGRRHWYALLAPMILCLVVMSGVGYAMGEAIPLIQDPSFQRGFQLLDPPGGRQIVVGNLQPPGADAPPVWLLAQWNSRFTLAGVSPSLVDFDGVEFANEAKRVVIAPSEGRLVLGVNSGVEYDGRARRSATEPWVHLLAEQELYREGAPSLAEMERLVFTVSARMTKAQNLHAGDENANLHAAQLLIHFTIQNRNRASSGYGDFYWFGVPLYDNRSVFVPRYEARDFAVQGGKFILNPGSRAYTNQTLHLPEWVHLEKDLLPLILQGLETAWRRGYLQDSKDLEDYFIGGINLGWEVPGLFDVEAEVKGLSLTAYIRR